MIPEDPPPSRPNVKVDWDLVGERLRGDPNQWYRVVAYPTRGSAATVAYQINRRIKHPALFRYGWFQAKSRTVEGEFWLYVRWLHS